MADEFLFAWDGAGSTSGPWAQLRVVRLEGWEEMSEPYRYVLELATEPSAEPPDPDDLVARPATLRIATQSQPDLKVVHGIVTEVEDVAPLGGQALYRLVLEPALARARHRRQCRIFLEKTIRQIVEAVLEGAGLSKRGADPVPSDPGDPGYAPAAAAFAWRISDASRLDEPRARPYVVQYNESDLDFVSRILEAEGISYHFENGDGVSLLVLSDTDAGRTRLDGAVGAGIDGREVGRVRLGGRLRPGRVVFGAYEWTKPTLSLTAEAGDTSSDLFEYVYPGGYGGERRQGEPLARARAERHHTEAVFARGEGSLRVLSAGTVVRLEHKRARLEGEYLVTTLHLRGHQEGALTASSNAAEEPFHAEFECARRGAGDEVAESRFRPAPRTPKPRILGTQTAVVTAEPSAQGSEVNVGGPGGTGCVRLRFHWDHDDERLRNEPSSAWVRVSQSFAGPGQGGVMHPRVGVEVIVEFEDGDPDRPLVTGRLYNGKNRPSRTAPTHSTLHSLSTPGGAVHNQISFDDTAGSELVYTNAGKDMTVVVGNDRRELVGANAQMTVGANDTEKIGANNTTNVGSNDSLTVGGDQTKIIGANRTRIVGANRTKIVGGSETRLTGANHVNLVGGSLTEVAGAAVTETYGATRSTTIAANWTEDFGANKDQQIGALLVQSYGGNQATTVGGFRSIQVGALLGMLVGGSVTNNYGASHTASVGAVRLHVSAGPITNLTSSLTINSPLNLHIDATKLEMFALKAAAYGFNLGFTGASASAVGMKKAAYGYAGETIGVESGGNGVEHEGAAIRMRLIGVLVKPAGVHLHL